MFYLVLVCSHGVWVSKQYVQCGVRGIVVYVHPTWPSELDPLCEARNLYSAQGD